MDSQRRHELEQNSLYQVLARLPALVADYGAYILLGVAVLVAVYFYFSTRSNTAVQEREAEAIGLYSMGVTIENARQYRERLSRLSQFLSTEDVTGELATLVSDFESYSMLPATSEVPGVRSRALRLRGDFNWALASFANAMIPAAATQPTTAPDVSSTLEAETYLAAAQAAYQQVLDKYPDQLADTLAAAFGLAAIAEQRGQFEVAGGHYDAIAARDDVPEGAKALAQQRKNLLGILALNPRLAKPMPSTLPTTLPATQPGQVPTTAAATQPTTQTELGEPANLPPDDVP